MVLSNNKILRYHKVQTSIPICKIPADTKANEASMPPMNIFCKGGKSGSRGHAPPGHIGIISSTIAGFITCNWSGTSVIPNTSLRRREAWKVHLEPWNSKNDYCYLENHSKFISERLFSIFSEFKTEESNCETGLTLFLFIIITIIYLHKNWIIVRFMTGFLKN